MKNIQDQYIDLLENKMSKHNFMRNIRMMFPQHISSTNTFEDSVKILKNRHILTEKKHSQDEIKNISPTEISMGTKVEMEHTNDPKKAREIALDHLVENPFYYTQLHLAGLADEDKQSRPKGKKSTKKRSDVEREVKKDNLVDKDNGMKKVKVLNENCDCNKTKKKVYENEHVNWDTISYENACKIKDYYDRTGRLPYDLSPEKWNEIKAQHNLSENSNGENYYQTNVQLSPKEQLAVKKLIPDATFEWDEDDRKQVVCSKMPEKNIQHAVQKVLGTLPKPSSIPNKNLGSSFNKFKSGLQEIIKEELKKQK